MENTKSAVDINHEVQFQDYNFFDTNLEGKRTIEDLRDGLQDSKIPDVYSVAI